MGIRVNFPLVYQTLLVVVQELDRIFDGDHVLFALAVDLVEHGRESGRLTRAGRPGDENETARFVAETFYDQRQSKSVEAFDFPRNRAENGPDRPPLVKNVA